MTQNLTPNPRPSAREAGEIRPKARPRPDTSGRASPKQSFGGPTPNPRKVKAVGLLSGGLDSMLAAKILKEMGVDVHAVHFGLPWGCGNVTRVKNATEQIGISLHVIPADQTFFEVLKNPRFGYGSAINPCVDCHIHMIKKASEFMKEINADFVFTGEVLGQRPMSQLKNSLRAVEKACGIEGRLLRPLCAKLLNPTIPEIEGLIDREKLLAICGRSRKEQRRLAKEFGITDFPNSSGGCLLTDKNFGNRLRDLFTHGCDSLEQTVILKWGRHFRINKNFKAILARDEKECDEIANHAQAEDFILQLEDQHGPVAVLEGKNPSEEIIALAAGLIQFFSRYRNCAPQPIQYWQVREPATVRKILAKILPAAEIDALRI